MTSTLEELRYKVARLGYMHRQMIGPLLPFDDAYASVAEYVAERGEQHVMSPFHHQCEFMQNGRCYENAWNLHRFTNSALLYCEGFALFEDKAYQHAWVFDPDKLLYYDPTWGYGDKMVTYLGCVFVDNLEYRDARIRAHYMAFAHALCLTQKNEYTYAIPRVATARRGDDRPVFGPWVEQVRRGFKIKDA